MSEEEIVPQEEIVEADPTVERDARCVPVAEAIVRLVGNHAELLLAEHDKTKLFEAYNGLAREVMKLLLEADIRVGEANYVMQLVTRPQEQVNGILFDSMNKHLAEMQKATFGCMIQEMGMRDLHSRLGGDTL